MNKNNDLVYKSGNYEVASPIEELVINLINELNNYHNDSLEDYKPVDEQLKLLLMNNSCAFMDNSVSKDILLIDGAYELDFLIGAQGNPKNIFYDYFEAYRIRHLVIFLDYFKSLGEKDDLGIIGNSNYITAIKTIAELFMYSYYNPGLFNGPFGATVNGSNIRFLPVIIAGIVLNAIIDLDEVDFEGSGITYDYFLNIINNIELKDILLGIHDIG